MKLSRPNARRSLITALIEQQIADLPPSTRGDAFYRHVQTEPATDWVINHNLGKWPSITVSDSDGSEVVGDIDHIDNNQTIIHFSAAISGEAICN